MSGGPGGSRAGVSWVCFGVGGAALVGMVVCLCLLCGTALADGDVNQAVCNQELEGFPGLTTESAAGFRGFLPDCRAYELVTPPYVAGQRPKGPNRELPAMSANGEHLLAVDYGGFAETRNLENNQLEYGAVYELSRTPSGWSTEALDPSASEYPRREFTDVASPDLRRTLWKLQIPPKKGEELPLEPPNGVEAPNNADFAIRESVGAGKGRFTLVGPFAAPGHVPSAGQTGEPAVGGVVGASGELTHILFTVPKEGKQSWPGDETIEGARALYEYDGTGGGEPVLVAVRNEASLQSEAAREGKAHVNEAAELISQCGSPLGDKGVTTATNAVSANGEVVYFTALAADEGPGKDACNEAGEGSGPPVNELYARVDGSRTVKISGTEAAEYLGASEDGAKVFFSEGERLYEAELGGGEHPAVTRLVTIAGGAGADVTRAAAISQNGEQVYFDSKAVLTTLPNANGEVAQDDTANPEEDVTNLYVYDTKTGTTALVAEQASVLQTTFDGRFALLRAQHIENTNDNKTGVTQLFEYDTGSGSHPPTIVRVSIGQQSAAGYECPATHVIEAGYDCDGNTAAEEPLAACAYSQCKSGETGVGTSGELDSPYNARSGLSIAADGTVVFTSTDALTPLAVAGGENVYEYRTGNVYLIAAGDEAHLYEEPRLFGLDETGQDVFFAATEQLVAQDTDTQVSWYDAREDGGFPAPVLAPGCHAEGCQGTIGVPPPLPSPGGSAVTPPGGNLAAPVAYEPAVKPKTKPKVKPCKKGDVKKKGRCIKKPKPSKARKSNRRAN